MDIFLDKKLNTSMKKIIIAIILLILVSVFGFVFYKYAMKVRTSKIQTPTEQTTPTGSTNTLEQKESPQPSQQA